MNDYTNKMIVITGGAQGIGACIAQTFVQLGATVIFCDHDEAAGKERERLLNKMSGASRATFIAADLSDIEQVKTFINKLIEQFHPIHLLINNAGIFSPTPLMERSIDEWDKVLAVNLRATYLCSQLLVKSLSHVQGNIINIASTRALMSEPDTEPYSASKGGIVALTHSLAMSLGQKSIRVNCISPGWIETSQWHLPPYKSTLRDIDHAQHPVGRVGQPEDIAQACLFLGSNHTAGFITGQNFIIDGGMTRKMMYAE